MTEYIFKIGAALLAVAAAYNLWFGKPETAFITGVLACVAFFFSVRSQVKNRNIKRETEREKAQNTTNE